MAQDDKKTQPTAAQDQGTNAYGVDLNDVRLKGGTDQPEAQAANEARMQAVAGTDRPVVEQIAKPVRDDKSGEFVAREGDVAESEADKTAEGDDKKKK